MKSIIFLIFLIILLCIFIVKRREGMETCTYNYLNPTPVHRNGEQVKWDPFTIKTFIDKYNKNNPSNKTNVDQLNSSLKWIWEKEAEYYIQYEKFPINSYIKEQMNKLKIPPDVDTKYTNRLIYVNHVMEYDPPTPSNESMASKIFSGKILPPVCSDSTQDSTQDSQKLFTPFPVNTMNNLQNFCYNIKN